MERSFHQRWKRSGMDFGPTRRRPRHFNQPLRLKTAPPTAGQTLAAPRRRGRKHRKNVHFCSLQGNHPLTPMPPAGGKSAATGREGSVK